jgi:hypothetical protein
MKKLLLVTVLLLFFIHISGAQETSKWPSENSFIEWNFGAAFIGDDNFPFPGTSVLWGKTLINENNFILEYEGGFALPTLVTGKIGIGKKMNNTNLTFGIRPFPFHLYTQATFATQENGYWITSIEVNPFGAKSRIFFESRAMLTFGYRWNLDK